MKKSRLFMATGALVLAATALFATKANKKFTLTDVGYNAAGTVKVTFPSNVLTTRKASGFVTAFATIATVNGANTHVLFRTALVTHGSNHKQLYID